MTRLKILIALVFAINLVQIHAQMEENEMFIEGSGNNGFVFDDVLPSDDEDLGDFISGSGFPDDYDDDDDDYYDDDEDNEYYDDDDDEDDEYHNEEDIDDVKVIELEPMDPVTPSSEQPSKEPVPENPTSFLNSTTFMAALIIAGSLGLVLALCVILLVVYRLRKKDQGSYPIDDDIKPTGGYGYTQGREIFA